MKFDDGWWIPEQTTEGRHPVNRRRKGLGIIRNALKYLPKTDRRMAIQAGGHLGLWPKTLAQSFQHVYTFEAHEENFSCLRANVHEKNITVKYAALGFEPGTVGIRTTKTTGSHFVKHEGGNCPVVTIDGLRLSRIDALFLDIEGYELFALHGAIETLKNLRPVVVCEQNTTCFRYDIPYGLLESWMETRGYSLVQSWKNDLIFLPIERLK